MKTMARGSKWSHSSKAMWMGLLCGAVGLSACGVQGNIRSQCLNASSKQVVIHAFDLAKQMPAHLSIMFSMSWFGIPHSDPQIPGDDPSYGNYEWGGGCVAKNDPATCSTVVTPGVLTRDTASKRRMLAGIYSVSGQDQYGVDRTDLMLSTLHRSCDDGAAVDAWSVQMGGLQYASLHPKNKQSTTADLPYRALETFLGEADKNDLSNAIIAGNDSTWYFHFGDSEGLGKCDNSVSSDGGSNPKQNCVDALTSDFSDLVKVMSPHKSAYRIDGKLVFYVYVDNQYLSAADWSTLITNARNAAGQDFYVIGTGADPAYFEAFDAISPWQNLGDWTTDASKTLYDNALAWVTTEHGGLFSGVGKYPGRVVFGAATPGFDDYTKDWGKCKIRELPPAPYAPRDPTLLDAQFDYFKTQGVKGVVLQTWDDWTEGSNIEPDVVDGTSVLTHVRDRLRELYGEKADPAGDTALDDTWVKFGQPYNCCFAGGKCPAAGVTPKLTCASTASASTTSSSGSSGGSSRTSQGSDSTSAGAASSSGTAGDSSGGSTGGCEDL